MVRIDRTSSDVKVVKAGVPQGSVLEPVLILIYINNLLNPSITNRTLSSFADYSAVIFSGSAWNEVLDNASASIKSIKSWLDLNLLNLNVSKTTTKIF